MSPNCEKIFKTCRWNDKEIKCCDYFLPLVTPRGHCLSMNTIFTQSVKKNMKPDYSRFLKKSRVNNGILTIEFQQNDYWLTMQKSSKVRITRLGKKISNNV